MIDSLIKSIIEKKNPVCVGLDTQYDYIPADFIDKKCSNPLEYAAQNIYNYNCALIDATKDIIPCVKVQVAYYELYGYYGMKAFYDTIMYAKKNGLFVIADIKRNDIGATATAYSTAYLGQTEVEDKKQAAFCADFVTLNGYLGTDGILPFINDCKKYDKGLFILVKTSNPSSGELQDIITKDNKTVYEHMADLVDRWGSDLIGEYGYSDVGAVIGATYPKQAETIRNNHKNMFVLIPGYGAQGGSAKGLCPNFDKRGLGGIVNNSRAILTAWKKQEGVDFAVAARNEVLAMQRDILDTFNTMGISY